MSRMLVPFKKAGKKAKASEETPPVYTPFLFPPAVPSAPIPDPDICDDFVFQMESEMTIHTRTPMGGMDELNEILGAIIDNYRGPVVSKPLFMSMYVLMGYHLTGRVNQPGNNIYESNLSARVRVVIKSYPEDGIIRSMNWSHSQGRGLRHSSIMFSCKIDPTLRSGHRFLNVWNAHPANEAMAPFNDVIREYTDNATISDSGDLIVIF